MSIIDIKNWLFANSRSQAWLAREIKISTVHLCHILQGKQTLTDNMKERLQRVINIDGNILFNGGDK